MTRQEILQNHNAVAVRPAKCGELFIARSWFNGKHDGYEVKTCEQSMKMVCVTILEKI